MPVNLDELEHSKENIQPIKRGRKADILHDTLKTPEHKRNRFIENGIREWEQYLSRYDGGDILDVWQQYIRWTEEHCVSGDNQRLLSLLERCTRSIMTEHLDQYKDDDRYLRVWLAYADRCQDPLDIFTFLHSKDIGTAKALFYEAWALTLESYDNFDQADKVFAEGVYRGAKPLERLKSRYAQFQDRMTAQVHQSMKQATSTVSSEPRPASARPASLQNGKPRSRKPFSSLPSTRKGEVPTDRSFHTPQPSTGGLSVYSDPSSDRQEEPGSARSNFAVFRDHHHHDHHHDGPYQPSLSRQATGNQLPPETTRHKENRGEPGVWQGERSRQHRPYHYHHHHHPSIDVHVDPDLSAPRPPPEPRSDRSLRPLMRTGYEGTDLSQHPLQNYPGAEPSPSSSQQQQQHHEPYRNRTEPPTSNPSVPPTQYPSTSNPHRSRSQRTRPKQSQAGYDKTAVMGGEDGDGEEMCFEELRSLLPQYRWRPEPREYDDPSASDMDMDMDMDMDIDIDEDGEGEGGGCKDNTPPPSRSHHHHQDIDHNRDGDGDGDMPSPTINTKMAMSDVLAMFNKPLPAEDEFPQRYQRKQRIDEPDHEPRPSSSMPRIPVFTDPSTSTSTSTSTSLPEQQPHQQQGTNSTGNSGFQIFPDTHASSSPQREPRSGSHALRVVEENDVPEATERKMTYGDILHQGNHHNNNNNNNNNNEDPYHHHHHHQPSPPPSPVSLSNNTSVTFAHHTYTIKRVLPSCGRAAASQTAIVDPAPDRRALLCCGPRVPWERRILDRVRDRMDTGARDRNTVDGEMSPVLQVSQVAEDSTMMLLTATGNGSEGETHGGEIGDATLGMMVRATERRGLDEVLAVFYGLELVKTVRRLHGCRIRHGGIDVDQVVLRGELMPGWRWQDGTVGVYLAGLGRAVDMEDEEDNGGDYWGREEERERTPLERVLTAMGREEERYSASGDAIGVCTVLHRMLFGCELQVRSRCPNTGTAGRKHWEADARFKAFWQRQMWTEIYDALLNGDGGDAVWSGIQRHLADYLHRNSMRARSLATLIYRQRLLLEEDGM